MGAPHGSKAEGTSAAFHPPNTFDQFVVERPLGRGGMGHVYLARDRGLDRPVALKFISAATPSSGAVERFVMEARAIARLSHPNVVGVYRVGEVEGRPYIAYELVVGQSLDQLALPLSWTTALRLATGIATGLEAVHAEGILHRDVKPANVMLSDRGEVKLIDFGLAKVERAGDEEDRGERSVIETQSLSRMRTTEPVLEAAAPVGLGDTVRADHLTRPGSVLGTPAYLAPEIWTGLPASPRSDIFALGLVLYELLVGKLPEAGLTGEALGRMRVDHDFPPIRYSRPDLPEAFANLVDRCLQREPEKRYATAADVRADLAAIQRVFLPTSFVIPTVQIEPELLAVVASFSRIRAREGAFSASVYERLFTHAPSVRELFPSDLTALRSKLVHTLELAVHGLSDPEHLVPLLEDLGRRHMHYGALPGHFPILERAMLEALAEHDATWSPEIERAWRRGFAFIESSMLRGMAAEQARAGSSDAIQTLRRHPKTPDGSPKRDSSPSRPSQPQRTRYAQSGAVSIAYQTFGQTRIDAHGVVPAKAPIDVVLLLGWLSHVELSWHHPLLARFLERLGRSARVTIFDKRGTGMSDRAFERASLDERMADFRAVVHAVNAPRPVLMGISEGAAMSALYAARYPDDVRGLVLYGGAARFLSTEDYPHGHPSSLVSDARQAIRERWGDPIFIDREAPSMAHDEEFREWLGLYMRMAASPGNAVAMLETNASLDIRDVVSSIRAPTLIVHRTEDRIAPVGGGRYLAEKIPGARFVELPGRDHLPFVGDVDAVLGEIEAFMRRL